MPHRDDVGLAGAARDGGHREVEAVGAALEGRQVAGDAVAGRLVRVELEVHRITDQLAGEPDRLADRARRRGARGVLEADAVEGDAGGDHLLEAVSVEFGGVGALALDAGGQAHHRDRDLVLHAGVVDALSRPVQVLDVVEGVEVADRRDAVLLEEIGMQLDDVGGLGIERDDVDAAREGLQIGLRARLAEEIHHLEGVFLAVEVAGLEAGAATGLEPADAGIVGDLHRRHEVAGEDAGAVDGLEAVAEGGAHELDLFLGHRDTPRCI